MNNIVDPEFVAESQPTLWTTEPKNKKKQKKRTCLSYKKELVQCINYLINDKPLMKVVVLAMSARENLDLLLWALETINNTFLYRI